MRWAEGGTRAAHPALPSEQRQRALRSNGCGDGSLPPSLWILISVMTFCVASWTFGMSRSSERMSAASLRTTRCSARAGQTPTAAQAAESHLSASAAAACHALVHKLEPGGNQNAPVQKLVLGTPPNLLVGLAAQADARGDDAPQNGAEQRVTHMVATYS
jgi:hypothetical protein